MINPLLISAISIIYVSCFSLIFINIIVLCVTGADINEKGVRFHIPELQMYFEPKIGDVMLLKASIIQHATRTRGSCRSTGYMCLHASFFLSHVAVSSE
jgi:hypothetical protein